MNIRKIWILSVLLLCCLLNVGAQDFVDLTADEVRIDSLLPVYSWQKTLGRNYADSTYAVSIEYPEFEEMTKAEIARYQAISGKPLNPLPEITQSISVSRKQGILEVSFVPLVFRDGKYQKLVSFKLGVRSQETGVRRRAGSGERYSDHSVLREGSWAKISIPESGIYHLSDALVKKAGFSNPSKVKIYGYGGALQPEKLTGDYLAATDDLQEVPTVTIGGRRLFYGVGPVTWASKDALTRTRNPYSDIGCYFLTESDEEPLAVDSAAFAAAYYPSNNDYHSLYEVDDFAWYHGGRNLYDRTLYKMNTPQSYTLNCNDTQGTLTVVLSYDGNFGAEVAVNDSVVDELSVSVSLDSYTEAAARTWTYRLNNLKEGDNKVTITQTRGNNLRLDYLALTSDTPAPMPSLSKTAFAEPSFVYRIMNQDHHADSAVDMVIIIPTTQKWLSQAERIKQLHEQRDGLTVRIVPADELYNEFSSGTSDATAYRRYMKMLYDRAQTDEEMPRYLLLFGDGAYDNRMRTAEWSSCNPDDFLLCFESENSFSHVYCYVSDDFYCLLDDEEQIEEGSRLYLGKPDVAVGRFSARTLEEAKVLVDKTISYANNEQAGAWQNTICMMGDDGNNNSHMATADRVANLVLNTYPGYNVQKIYWDAYTRTTTSTGNSFPDVTRLIKQQMADGALVMNYSGHGAAYSISHEMVLKTPDFAETTSLRLPLWITASCDIMPFDSQEDNIGETAMNNQKGGAIAFFGTTRTVYANYNEAMNLTFMKYVLGTDGQGHPMPIGEAVRRAKCDLVDQGRDTSPNKLQYTLLGDPALALATPQMGITIDRIGGQTVSSGESIRLAAGSVIEVSGHITGDQARAESFTGVVTATIRDAEETITCRLNNTTSEGADTAFVYQDRTKVLYHGSDSVRNGQFSFTFAVPKDISYTEGSGLMTLYAVNSSKSSEAHGLCDHFVLNGSSALANDSIGPSIYCYLNSSSFTNGGRVNATPYFVAELYDDSGINASGSSIGHDLELVIDGDMLKTYNLNNYFAYDFGDYRSGQVSFSIPELSEGKHTLMFRAWDIMNNSSTTELSFEVVKGEPGNITIDCKRHPGSNLATFYITHDRVGTQLDVQLDLYDASGRQLWRHQESGVSSGNVYTMDWNLSISGGRPLMTGVYIYRISVSSDGGSKVSQAKKMIITGNK
ncbi:MAG: type IX secretion system sortase PorU [Prevotella sp.]|nr:type IX secretion system sortase PorU [Prevotella sp.]